MKIHITIDILPSEVIALFAATKPVAVSPERSNSRDVQEDAVVKDCELNRTNPYWFARIGERVVIFNIGSEHCSVITKSDPIPIHDVAMERFTIVLPG